MRKQQFFLTTYYFRSNIFLSLLTLCSPFFVLVFKFILSQSPFIIIISNKFLYSSRTIVNLYTLYTHILRVIVASRPFLVSPCFRFETCVILYYRYESTVNQVERVSEGPNNLSLESRSIARGQIRDSEVVLRGSFARGSRAHDYTMSTSAGKNDSGQETVELN